MTADADLVEGSTPIEEFDRVGVLWALDVREALLVVRVLMHPLQYAMDTEELCQSDDVHAHEVGLVYGDERQPVAAGERAHEPVDLLQGQSLKVGIGGVGQREKLAPHEVRIHLFQRLCDDAVPAKNKELLAKYAKRNYRPKL